MNLMGITQGFPDQEACVQYREEKRRGQHPCSPHCASQRVGRMQEGNHIGRWNGHGGQSGPNLWSGAILARTMAPLPMWFLPIGWMVHARKSLAS